MAICNNAAAISYATLFLMIFCCIGQTFSRAICSTIFDSTAIYIITAIVAAASTIFYGILFVIAILRYDGYLPDVYGRQLRRDFAVLAFLNALAGFAESFSYSRVPLVLQLNVSHSVIPFCFIFLIGGNPNFIYYFSHRSTLGCVLIVMGILGHMSAHYLQNSKDGEIYVIWMSMMYLLSKIPSSLSAIYQQDLFSLRKLNVFYVLFQINLMLTLFYAALTPFNFAISISVQGLKEFLAQFVTIWQCFKNEGESYGRCTYAATSLVLYTSFVIAAQILQLAFVRRVSYRASAVSLMILPLCLFTVIVFNNYFDLFGELISDLVRQRQPKDTLFNVLMNFFFFAIVMIGSCLYRLDRKSGLSMAFALPVSFLTSVDEKLVSLYAPLLKAKGMVNVLDGLKISFTSSEDSLVEDAGVGVLQIHSAPKAPARVFTHHHAPSPLTLRNASQYALIINDLFASNEDPFISALTAQDLAVEKPKLREEVHIADLPPNSVGLEPKQLEGIAFDDEKKDNSLAISFMAAEQMKDKKASRQFIVASSGEQLGSRPAAYWEPDSINSSLWEKLRRKSQVKMQSVDWKRLRYPHSPSNIDLSTPIIKPVLMNPWCGSVFLEYSDYKRAFDSGFSFNTNQSLYSITEDTCDINFTYSVPSCSLLKQYTMQHIASLENLEEALRHLHAYYRMGSLAANILVERNLEVTSAASSSTSN